MILNKKDICIIAPAKLNLNLRIIRKDFDGYHFIKSHVCFIKLCDYIYISKSKKTSIYQDKLNSSFTLNNETILFPFCFIKFRFSKFTRLDIKIHSGMKFWFGSN